MERFERDWVAYAEGQSAARHAVGLAADTVQERASAALVTYVHTLNLSLSKTSEGVLRPIADSFTDGFLDEAIQRWGEEARVYEALLPSAFD